MSAIDPNSVAGRAIRVLREHPPGTKLPSRELCRLAGLRNGSIMGYTRGAVLRGHLVCEKVNGKLFLWSLPTEPPPDDQDAEAASLRALFYGGSEEAGDPLRGLSEALFVARRVMAAKERVGARFKDAEVSRFVARELRQISEAAERAKANLLQVLEVMG